MIHKGQLVEIPATSLLYKREAPVFLSKKEELLWRSSRKEYSLFDGFIVGGHFGIENFRIGQRKGINVGGKKSPLYVIAIDASENRIFVGAGEDHPALWTQVLFFPENRIEWLNGFSITDFAIEMGIVVKANSQILDQELTANMYLIDNSVYLELDQPISVTISNYPITISQQDTIIANITTI